MAIKPMPIKDSENLDAILFANHIIFYNRKEWVLIDFRMLTFLARELHIAELLFIVPFEMLKDVLAVQDRFVVVK
jgi:hypothetical protein